MSKDSGWAPYIRRLPRPEEIHFTALKNFLEMSKSITFKDFMHAYAVVTYRAWGSMKGYSLSLVNWPRKLQNMMVDWLDVP